jgi:hypothetical protein
MKRRHVLGTRRAVVACLAALALLVAAPVARAGDTVCIGVIAGTHDNVIVPEGASCLIEGPGTLIRGNVTALADSDLLIQGGVVVRGNVKGLPDSIVSLLSTDVGGDVIGDKTDVLNLPFMGNIVRGDIHVTGRGVVPLSEADVGVHICGVRMPNGNIEIEKMTISRFIRLDIAYCSAPNILENGSIKVEDNFIPAGVEGMHIGQAQIANGNLHVFKNRGSGPKTVMGNNVMNGDIQCYENDPPFVGGPNTGRAPKSVVVSSFPLPLVTAPNQCSGTSM